MAVLGRGPEFSRHEVLGRGHAERLVPMIAELPEKGRSDRILVSLGPGSFTGVRIGLATARALGLAWGAEVLGYPTLSLVASQGSPKEKAPITICMAGGHGEWFVQNFNDDGLPGAPVRSLPPEEAAKFAEHKRIAGTRAHELAELVGPDARPLDLRVDARHAALIQEDQLTRDLTPIYGRPPDAKKPGEA